MNMAGQGEGGEGSASEQTRTMPTTEELLQMLTERTAQVATLEVIVQQQQTGQPVFTLPVQVVPDMQAGNKPLFKSDKPDAFEGKHDPVLVEQFKASVEAVCAFTENTRRVLDLYSPGAVIL